VVVLAIIVTGGLVLWWQGRAHTTAVSHLRIEGRPGAQILIDDQPSGAVGEDGSATLEVPPGEHSIRLELLGFEPYGTTAAVKKWEWKTVAADMKPLSLSTLATASANGNLLIRSNVEGADIVVDGQLKGFTGTGDPAKIALNPGTHKVQLKKGGYKDSAEQAVEIAANKSNELVFKLTASEGAASTQSGSTLIVKSLPGAEIRLDGQPSGTVGADGTFPLKVSPGDHAVQASMNGYSSFSASVPVKSNAKTYVVAELKPLAPAITSFAAHPAKIIPGQSAKLSWSTQNATEVRIEPEIGPTPPSGSHDVSPARTTTYVLTARGKGGEITAKAAIALEASAADIQLINQTMARFKGAYDSMDVAALRREWPGMTQTQSDAMKTAFLGLTSVRLNDNCDGSPTINGDTAEWACQETISYVMKGRSIPDARHAIVYHFKRVGNRWYIERREGVSRTQAGGN